MPNPPQYLSTLIEMNTYYFVWIIYPSRRSQLPRGLRHELSSAAPTLGSWIRISLEAWMSVCVYCVCVRVSSGKGGKAHTRMRLLGGANINLWTETDPISETSCL
jgi:hypothetical protein